MNWPIEELAKIEFEVSQAERDGTNLSIAISLVRIAESLATIAAKLGWQQDEYEGEE